MGYQGSICRPGSIPLEILMNLILIYSFYTFPMMYFWGFNPHKR